MCSMRSYAVLAVMCAGALALSGCPADLSNGAADASSGPLEASTTCSDDPLAEMYLPNMKKTGTAGMFTFELVGSDPGPPIKGNNSWTVKITDASGSAVTDAVLKITPWMPLPVGHGTSVHAKATLAGDAYTVAPLYLFMGGVWQVTIAAKAGKNSDSAMFRFCID